MAPDMAKLEADAALRRQAAAAAKKKADAAVLAQAADAAQLMADAANRREAADVAGREVDAAAERVTALRRQLLQLRFNLGNILRDEARFEEAKALDETVLAEQRELLEPDHPHTLMTAGSLAADLKALGKYGEALAMDKVTYPAWTELYGDDYVRTLAAANNLADSYRLTADIDQALRLDVDTLERRRTTLGPLHPHTLLSTSNVARDLLEAGRYGEAVILMESARPLCIEALGADSLAALNAQMLLGIALRRTSWTHWMGCPKDSVRPVARPWPAGWVMPRICSSLSTGMRPRKRSTLSWWYIRSDWEDHIRTRWSASSTWPPHCA
jgi:tetratricopeptide (TPR) repeat protein